MLAAQHRAPRYSFSANIDLIDVESKNVIKERTSDLSLFGCFVMASSPWPVGSKVRLKIVYKGSVFTAVGHVVHVRENGMGVKFLETAPKDEMVLEIWMAELRGQAT